MRLLLNFPEIFHDVRVQSEASNNLNIYLKARLKALFKFLLKKNENKTSRTFQIITKD